MRWVAVAVVVLTVGSCGRVADVTEPRLVEEPTPTTLARPVAPSSTTTSATVAEEECPGTVQERLDAVLDAVVDPATGFPVIDPAGASPIGVPVLCSLADAREFAESRPAPAPMRGVPSDVEARVIEVSAVGGSFEVVYEGEWRVFGGPFDTTGSTVRYLTVALAAETGMYTRITTSEAIATED